MVGLRGSKKRISELGDLKMNVFGHIHFGRGIYCKDGIRYSGDRIEGTVASSFGKIFVNASICSELYCPVNGPIIVELPSRI